MKFTKIRLIGLYTTDLPIVGALPSDPYILKAADGLGPPEIDVFLSETLNADSVYQGSRPQSREPVLRIGLNPDHGAGQSAADLRSSLYGLLTPGAAGHILLEIWQEDTLIATTKGHAKKLEIAPFSQEPEVQLTMACLNPYLEAPVVLFVTPGGTKSAPEIVNTGTAFTNFHMEVLFTEALSGWTIFGPDGKKMSFDYDFVAGDKLMFDTRPGYRDISITRDLITTKILESLTMDSSWLRLHGGTNVFTTSSPSFNWGDVYFRPLYWGV